jgi:hypothetical protein
MGLAMIKAQGAIFGWVSDSQSAISAIKGPSLKLASG